LYPQELALLNVPAALVPYAKELTEGNHRVQSDEQF
jgi:hypothetical protein